MAKVVVMPKLGYTQDTGAIAASSPGSPTTATGVSTGTVTSGSNAIFKRVPEQFASTVTTVLSV